MKLQDEILHKMIPYATDKNISLYLTPINDTLEEFNIKKPIEIAQFIAQITHESGSLAYVEELASGSAYEYRRDLGNMSREALTAAHAKGTTTGKFYKGRGLIQVTGYFNYKECGIMLGIDLVNNPELLKEPKYAAKSAGWFWFSRGLNKISHDCKRTTRVINGGYNGLAEREAYFKRNCLLLSTYN